MTGGNEDASYLAKPPRDSCKRNADPKSLGLGDCIDYNMCVQVCPTGIDIRNGLQMECIGCANCIDACDEIMDQVGFEKGLIRYITTDFLFLAHPASKKRWFPPDTAIRKSKMIPGHFLETERNWLVISAPDR